MRSVSSEGRRRRRRSPGKARGVGGAPGSSGRASAIPVAVSDTIECLDLDELRIDDLELLAQPLDVAVDGAVVDIDVLAIGGVHQLVAALDVPGAGGERFQDEELGDRELD